MLRTMALLMTIGPLWAGCAAFKPPIESAPRSFIDERATLAIAFDTVKLLQRKLPPARTTLLWVRPAPPEQLREAAYHSELARQLRVAGYALSELATPDETSGPARGTQLLTAALRPLSSSPHVYCAVVRVSESQWARCYNVGPDNASPAGVWSVIVFPAGST